MAQYFWDFSDQVVDGAVPDGFTQRGVIKTAPAGYTVIAGPAVRWESDGGDNGYSILTPDAVGIVSGDVEIYIEWESAGLSGNAGGVVLRAQDTDPQLNCYWAAFVGGGAEIVGGRIVTGIEEWATLVQPWAINTVYAMRARVSTNVVGWRVFAPGGAEGAYTTYTDSASNFASGRIGLLGRGYAGPRTFRKLGIGTAGDAAPTAPVGSAQSVTLAAPLATAGQRLRTMPDLAPGDIVEYEVFAGTGTITVNTNGSFVASAGVTHFRYRVNDGGGFGDWVVDEVRAQRVRPATIIRLPGFGASGSGTVS